MTIALTEDAAARVRDATGLTERNIAAWDALYAQSPRWNRYPCEELSGFVGRVFPDSTRSSHLRALEIGCGPGTNLWFMAREGFDICGIDGSATAVKAARHRLASEGIAEQADLRVGNFSVLPWPDRSFDAVIDVQSISHNTMSVIEIAMAEVHRVLKPGGWFFGRMFGDATTGIASGDLVEDRTTRGAQFGPLAGCGIVHGFSAPELGRLLSDFASVRIDWVHRRTGPGFDLFEWIVHAQRP